MKKLLFLFLSLLFFSGTLDARGQGIRFADISLKNALKQAKEENKIVFVDFMATWCGPCKKMTVETFNNPAVGEYFNKKFICIQVDVDKEKGLAKKYKVRNVPTYVLFDQEGKEIARKSGFMEANRFLHFVQVLMKDAPSFEDLWNECRKDVKDFKARQVFLLEAPNVIKELGGDKVEQKKWVVRVQKILEEYIAMKPRAEMVNVRDLMIIFTYCLERPQKENEIFEFVIDNLSEFLKIAPHQLLTRQLTRYEISLINQLAIAGDRDYLKEIDRVNGDMKVLFDSVQTKGVPIERMLKSNAESIYALCAEKDQAKYLELKREYLESLGDNAQEDDYVSSITNLMKATGVKMSAEGAQQCLVWLDKLLTFKSSPDKQATYVATMGDCFAHLKNTAKAKECYNQAYLLSMQTKNIKFQTYLMQRINALGVN